MKFKKNWKRFWTLDRHCAEGFTLVELIVVIAILAILGGVAVPAYSGYVEKANMAADQTLAAEVANALLLQYYSDPAAAAGGYVVLSTSGAEGDGAMGTAAMTAAFGEGWDTTAALKYDGWANDGSMMNYVLNMDSDAVKTVADSTFLNSASTDGMMGAITNLTGAAGKVIQTYANNGGNVSEKLSNLLGADNSVVTSLNALTSNGLDSSSDGYYTAVSNLLVGYFADQLSTKDMDELDELSSMAITYATMYAYAESIGDTSQIDILNEKLSKVEDMDLMDDCFAELDETFIVDYTEYMNTSGETDALAVLEMMGAVSNIASGYTDAESLTNAGLYTSDSVTNQVNEYVNTVKAVAAMEPTALEELKNNAGNGSVMISCFGGVVSNPLAG